MSDEQIGQHLEHVVRADLASHHDRQALPRVLVQHCHEPDGPGSQLERTFRPDPGPVPPELGNLTNLTELQLEHNELTGPVPQSFLALEMLTWFFFQGNAGLCAPNTTEVYHLAAEY